MTDYVTTQGKVISSTVGIKESVVNLASDRASRNLKEMYYPDITYQYRVNGTDYENNQFWDEDIKIGQLEKIEPIVAQHPEGTNVTVYYNPDNPSDAYLQALPKAKPCGLFVLAVAGLGAIPLVITLSVLGS